MNNNDSTANAILVVLLVVVVGFIVWFIVDRRGGAPIDSGPDAGASLEVNLPGGNGQDEGASGTQE
ncbi:MAG: hypothetical protein HZA81_02670 [Candidatus Taylorbacteria bacterium]|nr:hypothetical protein [Candidatus Taylorbacteria bacterium]